MGEVCEGVVVEQERVVVVCGLDGKGAREGLELCISGLVMVEYGLDGQASFLHVPLAGAGMSCAGPRVDGCIHVPRNFTAPIAGKFA
jgi:hypothetical protein